MSKDITAFQETVYEQLDNIQTVADSFDAEDALFLSQIEATIETISESLNEIKRAKDKYALTIETQREECCNRFWRSCSGHLARKAVTTEKKEGNPMKIPKFSKASCTACEYYVDNRRESSESYRKRACGRALHFGERYCIFGPKAVRFRDSWQGVVYRGCKRIASGARINIYTKKLRAKAFDGLFPNQRWSSIRMEKDYVLTQHLHHAHISKQAINRSGNAEINRLFFFIVTTAISCALRRRN